MNDTRDDLRGLQEVRVGKVRLLEVIKENKVKHAQQFDEAYAGWRVTTIEQLENDLADQKKVYRRMVKEHKKTISQTIARLNRVKGGDFITDASSFRVAKPAHHIEDYDGAIKKLEMSLDDELELSPEDFDQFVMDQWHWKLQFEKAHTGFLQTYSMYSTPQGRGIMSGSFTSAPIMTGSITSALLDGSYKFNSVF